MNGQLKLERKDSESISHLTFRGIIDEESDFSAAFANLGKKVLINLEGIKLINSVGVREWVQYLQKIPPQTEVMFEKCSIRVVEQINLVSDFLGQGNVVSFYAPYFCGKCKNSVNLLLEVKDLSERPVHAPAQNCPTCNTPMEFDDIEEEYFSFLN